MLEIEKDQNPERKATIEIARGCQNGVACCKTLNWQNKRLDLPTGHGPP